MSETFEQIGAGKKIGVLTSGGDAQGMNAAVRAVVRTALTHGAEAYAIFEGYQGMIDGGDGIRRLEWGDVGSILHKGGTMIGTFRSLDFRERAGRCRAARNLLEQGIDRLVVIGGDGSLSGLNEFSHEWTSLLEELVASGEVTQELADAHPTLRFAGLVGSIDNDLVGTDMTIGADSALHRIVDAIDALTSTAASHQRSFVVEVMGRHCGYLPLMAAVAGGCDYVLVPENPPDVGWEDRMCAELRRGRAAGRRDSLVIVAEGATDRAGNHISADYVKGVIEERLKEDTRVTILGHVQRGGTPSAFDRWCSTLLGHEAALEVLGDHPSDGPVIGFKGNRVARLPLVEAVRRTREVPKLIEAGDYAAAMAARGSSFVEMFDIFHELAEPSRVDAEAASKRIAIVHGGGLGPGMNTVARAAVRLGISRGHTMLGIEHGFVGLRDGVMRELEWEGVEGWVGDAGAHLGLRRDIPTVEDLYKISRKLEDNQIDALIVAGGWNAYRSAHLLYSERDRYPAFRIPIVCIPVSIDNNLPGSELAVGADTALQSLVDVIDRVKMSAEAVHRCFVLETMGRYCGYLALMSGLAGGAERVYLHEEGITLDRLSADSKWMRRSFAQGRELVLAIRNELANPMYTTDVLARIFEEEGGQIFDVRQTIVGHLQQGGAPTPFDRLLGTRLASRALRVIDEQFTAGETECFYLGLVESSLQARPFAGMMAEMDPQFRRPKSQWWLGVKPIVEAVSVRPDEREPDAAASV